MPALPTVARAAGAIVAAVGIRASDIDSPLTPDPPIGVGSCGAPVDKAALADEDVLAAAWGSALPIGEVLLAGCEGAGWILAGASGKPDSGTWAGEAAIARWSV